MHLIGAFWIAALGAYHPSKAEIPAFFD